MDQRHPFDNETEEDEPRVKIFVVVEADEQIIFSGEYYSVDNMIEDSRKPEHQISLWEKNNA